MEIAIVLREVVAIRQLDLSFAGRDFGHPRANGVHNALERETGADSFLELVIEWFHQITAQLLNRRERRKELK
jgi:hypothetical protein